MHIACSINKEFTRHMCVMLKSLLINTKEKIVNVHILNTDLTEIEESYICEMFKEEKSITLYFYKVDSTLIENIPIVAESLTIETLYRILLPLTVSTEIDKILYIDSDIVIKSDVSEVFNIELGDYYLAAVPDIYEKILDTIKLDTITDYFNAGFILINLKKWRDTNFFEKCIKFSIEFPERIQLADQDVLNGVLNGEWYRLPLKWNVVRNMIYNTTPYYKYFDKKGVDEAIKNPSLIHYSSADKPWHFFDDHPYKEEYHNYLELLDKSYDRFEDFEILNNKKVVLFGTGERSKIYTKLLNDFNIVVDYYVDNNQAKWGKIFNNKKILDPNDLNTFKEDYYVFIASQFYNEIKEQLIGYGYEKVREGFTRI